MTESINSRIEKKSLELEKKQNNLDTQSISIERQINLFTRLAWISIFVGIVVVILGIYLLYRSTPPEIKDLNELGGFYSGTIASIWSLSGLFFIYVAFLGQKKQLLLQQIELLNSQLEVMYTQYELQGQKEAMNKQNELITHQQFENTFFKLMENHIEMVQSMTLAIEGDADGIAHRVKVGKPCMITIKDDLRTRIIYTLGLQSPIKNRLSIYEKLYPDYAGLLSYYFRNLYHIIKFIHESRIDNKKRYSNFIRAQFSPAEIELLTYNGISNFGKRKFKPLIEEYSLLKHCENQQLREQAISENWYKPIAFGEYRNN